MENPNNHHIGVGSIGLTIGLNIVTWFLAILEHFVKHPAQSIDIVFGFVVKAAALTASIYTIILVRKKLKNKVKDE